MSSKAQPEQLLDRSVGSQQHGASTDDEELQLQPEHEHEQGITIQGGGTRALAAGRRRQPGGRQGQARKAGRSKLSQLKRQPQHSPWS